MARTLRLAVITVALSTLLVGFAPGASANTLLDPDGHAGSPSAAAALVASLAAGEAYWERSTSAPGRCDGQTTLEIRDVRSTVHPDANGAAGINDPNCVVILDPVIVGGAWTELSASQGRQAQRFMIRVWCTVITHEQGHLRGYGDVDVGIMSPERETPGECIALARALVPRERARARANVACRTGMLRSKR